MPFRNRLALQTVPQFITQSAVFVPIPGLEMTVKANSTFYVDLRFFAVQSSGPDSLQFRIDGWTPQIGSTPNPAGPSFLNWTAFNYSDGLNYEQGFFATPPENMEWTTLPHVPFRGNFYIFGLIRNDEAFDQQLIVSARVRAGFSDLSINGGRLILFEEISSQLQSINSDMTHCGCCATAEISCCQTSLTINTINPSSSFDWKITDGLGAVYTGTMETDSGGVGVITVGDGMDLPDGFLDAPGVGFKIEFLDGRPTIASKMSCLDVELVSGAYLAIQDIGEPLP